MLYLYTEENKKQIPTFTYFETTRTPSSSARLAAAARLSSFPPSLRAVYSLLAPSASLFLHTASRATARSASATKTALEAFSALATALAPAHTSTAAAHIL